MFEMIAAQAAGGIGKGIGDAIGGGGGPVMSGAPVNSWVDGSGWSVATGGGKTYGSQRSDSALGAAAMDNSALMWIGLAVIAFVAVRKLRK